MGLHLSCSLDCSSRSDKAILFSDPEWSLVSLEIRPLWRNPIQFEWVKILHRLATCTLIY